MQQFLATPAGLVRSLVKNWGLLWELVKRDFVGRYKGSVLGVIWSLFNPLLMLTVYTLVFSVAFQTKWGVEESNKAKFAIVLFSGMIVHALFAECLNRAPTLITSTPNFVRKVVFPLEILPWMALFSALLHFSVSFCVLVLFCVLTATPIHAGILLAPIVLIPLVFMLLGFSWVLASLGVYLRDLAQILTVVTSVTLFLAPVFYPIEALPEAYQSLMLWNPITLPVMELRDVMLWGKSIDWSQWFVSLILSLGIFQIGFWWFQKTRSAFADVL